MDISSLCGGLRKHIYNASKSYCQSSSRVASVLKLNGILELKYRVCFSPAKSQNSHRNFTNLLTVLGYDFLHYSMKYLKLPNVSCTFWNFFQLMSVFRKGFQRNLQDSIQMLGITTRNSNAHFHSRKNHCSIKHKGSEKKGSDQQVAKLLIV